MMTLTNVPDPQWDQKFKIYLRVDFYIFWYANQGKNTHLVSFGKKYGYFAIFKFFLNII